MAKRLLQEMIDIASSRQLSKMTAYVRAENKPMLSVFTKAGFKRKNYDDPSEVFLELELTAAPAKGAI